jgi:nickel-type superoxide dismutase maturation protease
MTPGRDATRLVALVLGLVVATVVARRWLDVVAVRGQSMSPTLRPGDRLLVARLARSPVPGEIVLAPDPRAPWRELVKRVAGVDGSNVVLRGDNPVASTDARTFGSLPASAVRWRVVLRYWPRPTRF